MTALAKTSRPDPLPGRSERTSEPDIRTGNDRFAPTPDVHGEGPERRIATQSGRCLHTHQNLQFQQVRHQELVLFVWAG
jgi:hypothetical protein